MAIGRPFQQSVFDHGCGQPRLRQRGPAPCRPTASSPIQNRGPHGLQYQTSPGTSCSATLATPVWRLTFSRCPGYQIEGQDRRRPQRFRWNQAFRSGSRPCPLPVSGCSPPLARGNEPPRSGPPHDGLRPGGDHSCSAGPWDPSGNAAVIGDWEATHAKSIVGAWPAHCNGGLRHSLACQTKAKRRKSLHCTLLSLGQAQSIS